MSQEKPEQESFTIGDLLAFVKLKREALAKDLRARAETIDAWSSGTSAEWRAVGCKLDLTQRIKVADMHKAIAAAQRREVAMFNAIIDVISRCQL